MESYIKATARNGKKLVDKVMSLTKVKKGATIAPHGIHVIFSPCVDTLVEVYANNKAFDCYMDANDNLIGNVEFVLNNVKYVLEALFTPNGEMAECYVNHCPLEDELSFGGEYISCTDSSFKCFEVWDKCNERMKVTKGELKADTRKTADDALAWCKEMINTAIEGNTIQAILNGTLPTNEQDIIELPKLIATSVIGLIALKIRGSITDGQQDCLTLYYKIQDELRAKRCHNC